MFCHIVGNGIKSLSAISSGCSLFSDQSYTGTARSHAMGNAFGALGADMTSIHINPAGLGVYRTFSMSATTGLECVK